MNIETNLSLSQNENEVECDEIHNSNLDVNSVLETSFCILNQNSSIIEQNESNNTTSTSSHHEGESILEMNSLQHSQINEKDLEKMEVVDLLSLCKMYRNFVVKDGKEKDIEILQSINLMLEKKLNPTQNANSKPNPTLYPTTINTAINEKVKNASFAKDFHDGFLPSISQNNNDKNDEQDGQDGQNGQDGQDGQDGQISQPNQIFTLPPTQSMETANLNDVELEEVEGTVFQSEMLKSLEVKLLRFRKRESIDLETSNKKSKLE